MTLKEIYEEKGRIEDMLYESGGELTPEIEEALGLNEASLKEKIDGYHKVVVNMEYGMGEIDAEIKRLQTLKKVKENSVKRLKEHLQYHMEQGGEDYVEGVLTRARIQNNAPLVEVDEGFTSVYELMASALSVPDYIKISVSVDKKALKETLKDSEVEGARMVQTRSLRFF